MNGPRWIGIAVLSVLLGCGGSQPRRVAVSGSVVVGEELIATGSIRFLPQAGNHAQVVVTTIADGLYRFSNQNGPTPGRYKVIVNLELDAKALRELGEYGTPPPLTWEDEVEVPDEKSATQHFVWKQNADADSTSR